MIIFLDGTSSSGKSSIASELLKVLDVPYFHLAVDAFGAMRSVERTLELDGPAVTEVLCRTRAGFHRAVAGMAQARGDRVPGAAARQLRSVHQHGLHDFEVDTGTSSPRNCAEAVKEFLRQPPARRAFEVLRRR